MKSDLTYRRFWLLALLQGVESAGRSPIELKHLHSLVYLANALSPCYGIESLNATVLKEGTGPLYPDLIWDTDRLVGVGLLAVSNLVFRQGAELRSASYSITASGVNFVSRSAAGSTLLATVAKALGSVALAYARNPDAIIEVSLLQRDGNYADPHFGLGDVVDFGEWDPRNASANAVRKIDAAIGGDRTPSSSVNLYTQYLAAHPGQSHD